MILYLGEYMGLFTDDKNKFSWTNTLATVAPALAASIGGPLAGTGVQMLSNALLGKPDASQEEIAKLFMGGLSPDQLAACKKAENDFTAAMEELGIRREQLYLEDVKSAREREVSTGDAVTPRILAFIVLAGFYYSMHFIFSGEAAETLKDPNIAVLVGSVIGYASAKADQVLSYFFGSSLGSKQKTDAMANAAMGVATKK
jgi:hypothetical protein